ncbi:hypothetical protein KSP40_PGU006886 [Platanthera guangdongensis]|uniref:Uncharacterized protein n=1 Tax=Platanthera guangdongensis TaxID=2320717 RepID=A0ABR2M2U6_9ASPA
MDFVHELSRSQCINDVVWVIVDRLTKISQFISNKKDDLVENLAKLYVDNIVRVGYIRQNVLDLKKLINSKMYTSIYLMYVSVYICRLPI